MGRNENLTSKHVGPWESKQIGKEIRKVLKKKTFNQEREFNFLGGSLISSRVQSVITNQKFKFKFHHQNFPISKRSFWKRVNSKVTNASSLDLQALFKAQTSCDGSLTHFFFLGWVLIILCPCRNHYVVRIYTSSIFRYSIMLLSMEQNMFFYCLERER